MSVWNDCVQSYLSDFITSPKVQQEEKDHSNANICLHCCNIQAGQLSHIYKATEVKMCVCVYVRVCVRFLTLIVPTQIFLPFFSLVSFKKVQEYYWI
jgi:hypothetical protein